MLSKAEKNRFEIAEENEAELRRVQAEVAELRKYLLSPKFHVDSTVQVSDIFARLGNVIVREADGSHSVK